MKKLFTTVTSPVHFARRSSRFLALLLLFGCGGVLGQNQSISSPPTAGDIVFNQVGTWTLTVPDGYYINVTVQAWGGGGGGKIGNNAARSGGGGGAYASSTFNLTSSGSPYSVTVGGGGAAGANGGNSSFTTQVIALGGSGTNNGNLGALGGSATGSTGSIRFSGGKGGDRVGGESGTTGSGGGGGGAAGASGNGSPGGNGTATGSPPLGGAGGNGNGLGGNGGKGGDDTNTNSANDAASGAIRGGGGGGKCDRNNSDAGSGGRGEVIVTVNSFLPIQLYAFSGAPIAEGIALKWTTASETNNDYMAVEHSVDGLKFAEIGRVQGVGTTTEEQNYSFLDTDPAAGANYYRLRQVDLDGATEYHRVIYVDFAPASTSLKLEAFPNPATDKIRVSWPADERYEGVLQVFNLSGQLLASYRVPGKHATFELPVGKLAAGAYIVSLTQGKQHQAIRFVKE